MEHCRLEGWISTCTEELKTTVQRYCDIGDENWGAYVNDEDAVELSGYEVSEEAGWVGLHCRVGKNSPIRLKCTLHVIVT